jgi:hypothetical protein
MSLTSGAVHRPGDAPDLTYGMHPEDGAVIAAMPEQARGTCRE